MAGAAGIGLRQFEIVATGEAPAEIALRATALAREGPVGALMKGSLHTDELMSAVSTRRPACAARPGRDREPGHRGHAGRAGAGHMLYKSFNYIGGGDCAGLVLGARVPILLTSRADSLHARLASVALAVLAVARR